MRWPVSKEQLSGSRWQNRRVEQAVVHRSIRNIGSPARSQSQAIWMGVASMVIMCVIGFIVAKIAPQSAQRDAKLVSTASGGLYVQYGDRFHPVTNLASARLILGTPEAAKPVKDTVLATRPRGQLMGILAAPNMLEPHSGDLARWTVCDSQDQAVTLTSHSSVTTTVLAASGSQGQHELTAPNAVLVKDPNTAGQVWVLWGNQRATVGADDKAAQAALSLTAQVAGQAAPISRGLLDAITAVPPITTPFISGRGNLSGAVAGMHNGDIVRSQSVDGSSRFTVVFDDGIQQVSAFIAELLSLTGSTVTTTPPPAMNGAARVQHIDIANYPANAPVYVHPSVLCWTWSRGGGDAVAATKLTVGDQLPLNAQERDNIVKLLPAKGIDQAQQAYTEPGKGWYARVTGNDPASTATEQPLWIDDTGVRYFIGLDSVGLDKKSYDGTVQALGINANTPLPIPWSIARLYAQGPTLSKPAALTLHESPPPGGTTKACYQPVSPPTPIPC